MGNKMSCLCRRGEEYNEEEGIYMEVLNRGEVPEENSEESDRAQYLELIEDPQPLYDLPYDNPPETIRLRITAEHHYSTRMERWVHYENTIRINPNINIETTECLAHISAFNSRYEMITDLTYINDLSSNALKRRILYRRDPVEDTWTVSNITDDDQTPQNEIQFRSVESVFVLALTTHKKQGSKVKKCLYLSKKPVAVVVPLHMKESMKCVVHIASYNLHMMKIFEMIIVRAKRQGFPAEYYIQCKGQNMDSPCNWYYTDQPDVGPF